MALKAWMWTLVLCLPYIMLNIQRNGLQESNFFIIPFAESKTGNSLLPGYSTNASIADTMPVDLAAYYKYTNLAARAIYDNQFEQASTLYDTAFMHKVVIKKSYNRK